MLKPYRFEVRQHPEAKQPHIVIFAGNNEVVLSGEPKSSEAECHETIQSITDAIFFMKGKPLYTEHSPKPPGWIDDRPLGGV